MRNVPPTKQLQQKQQGKTKQQQMHQRQEDVVFSKRFQYNGGDGLHGDSYLRSVTIFPHAAAPPNIREDDSGEDHGIGDDGTPPDLSKMSYCDNVVSDTNLLEEDNTTDSVVQLNATANTRNAINNVTHWLNQDEEMPDLTSDSSDLLFDYFSDSNDSVMDAIHTMEDYNTIKNNRDINNVRFEEKENATVKRLREYKYDLGVLDVTKSSGVVREPTAENGDSNIHVIEDDGEYGTHINFINNVTTAVDGNDNVLLTSDYKYQVEDDISDVYGKAIIKDSDDQWIITVPIKDQNGNVENTKICADPGANSACVDTDWAFDNFGNMICRNKGSKRMDTPGGVIAPRYCLWMTFPTASGIQLMRKMYLVDNLPVKVLADINMLKAFGYKFDDGIPPAFRHNAEDESNYGLRDDFIDYVGNYVMKDEWIEDYSKKKLNNFINYLRQDGFAYSDENICYDFDYRFDHFDENARRFLCNNQLKFVTSAREFNEIERHIIDYDKINPRDIFELHNSVGNICNMVNFVNKKSVGIFRYSPQLMEPTTLANAKQINVIRNKRKIACPVFHRCLFLMAKQSFLASPEEISEAQEMVVNKKLEFNDLSYLKQYGVKYGKEWTGTYEKIMDWIENNRDIFAQHQFDRRTLNVPPARLGINKSERNTTMYAAQYPINHEKRLYMINYTLMNEKNGFWHPIKYSLHCIPYTMIPKKKNGVIYLYRPAFDARVVNQHCTLMPIIMPTIKDFRELHAIKGFVTMADFKNFFDCIPLHKDDWKYTAVHTPIGLYEMSCLTYGFVNSASEAQKIVNPIAVYIGDCLIYIDDICIKHRIENGIDGIIDQLNKMAFKIRSINGYLNPSKFFPACDYSEGFGWQNTMIGTMCSESYKRKMLAVTKPRTKKEIQSFLGLINYMNSNIYNCKIITYWISKLIEETDSEGKNKHVKWTREANLSWEQIRWLIAHLPLLHHPTISGTFCLQTDACNYGIGGVLWQRQINPTDNNYKWYIIDMHSKVVPKGLRKCNAMILEAYAIAVCCEHWSFHLRGREFIISTDNMPIANVFGKKWKELTTSTQKTLESFRSRIADLEWESFHIEGLNNPIADGLSRFTLKLIDDDRSKPPLQQRFPLQLSTINGDDLDTPTLTEDERKERFVKKVNRLEEERKELIKNSSVMLMRCIDGNKLELNYKSNKNVMTLQPIDKIWNNRIMNIRNNVMSINSVKMNDLIYSLDSNILRGKSYNFSNKLITNEMEDGYVKVMNGILKETIDTRNNILSITNILEKKIFDGFQFSDISKINIIQQVQTRSQSRKAKQKSHLPQSQRDFRRKIKLKTNNEFQNIKQAIDTRKELIAKLFGNVKDKRCLDLDRFYQYQISDNVINVINDLYNIPRSDWKKKDLDFIKEWEPVLYRLLKSNKIKRKSGILMVELLNKQTNQKELKFIVPFTLIGDLMVHYHHSHNNFHNSADQTIKLLQRTYWWSTLSRDVNSFCKSCILCQQLSGTQRNRTPLQIRINPPAFYHIFADFLGPIYARFYVLVIVDQRSGFCRLITTDGCDALTVLENLINKWITLFGYPRLFESDWGAGFNNRLMNTFAELTGMKIEIAEPRYHRSIGKVERVIRVVQNIIAKYNIALKKQLTDSIDEIEEAWQTIEIIIPQIQFNMNQYISRIGGLSANEIAFGRRFCDPTNNIRLSMELKDLEKENDQLMPKADLEAFKALTSLIDNVNKKFINDWTKYIWLSRRHYNDKNKITLDKINNYQHKFKVGEKVLYFIGDKQVAMKKWREKWSGPWIVEKHINETTLIITDPETGDQRRTNFNRIKLFKEFGNDYVPMEQYLKNNEEYIQFQQKLLDEMRSNKGVDIRQSQFDLDYSQ